MARRTLTVVIDTPAQPAVPETEGRPAQPARPAGRDHGKTFLLTEMSAAQAEEWAIKALLALAQAGVEIPDESAGVAGLAKAGFDALTKLSYAVVKPLLDDMLTCVQYLHKPGNPPLPLSDAGVEEVGTFLKLRKEVFKLHTGF